MPGIDHQTPIPLYYQLKQLLKDQIQRGELRPGSRIPTEDELCQTYNISRTPVRQALSEMVHEGLLVRTPGRGTFVAEPDGGKGGKPVTRLRVVFSDSRWRELLESALTFYNSEHPELPLHLDALQVPLWDIHDFLVDAVGRGEAPDISVLDSVWVAEFAHQRHLIPLDEADPGWYRAIQEGYFPAMLDPNRYQDHLYGMPVCGDASVLWYRKDWLAAERLEPPATWEDLVAVARHFQGQRVRERYGLGVHPLVFVAGRNGGETTTYQLLPFLWSTGGELVAGRQVLLDSPATRRMLNFLVSLVHEHKLVPPEVVDYNWDRSAQVFAAGKAALALGGTYENFFIRDLAGWDEGEFQERVAFVPIPAGQGGEPATLVWGMNYVLYQQSQVVQQSLAMLRMTVQPQILKPFCVRTGQIPAPSPIAQAILQEEDGFVSRTIPLLRHARTRPSLPDFARVSALFRTMVEDCLTGRRTIDRAVTLTAEKIGAITDFPL